MKKLTRRQAISAAAIGSAVGMSHREATADDERHNELRCMLRWQPKEAGKEWDTAESLWLRKRIVELKAIKIGVTRGELEKELVSDGPTRSRAAHRYQHPRCPFIKLDVFFDVENSDALSTENSEDKVVRIEGPHVDLSSNFQRW